MAQKPRTASLLDNYIFSTEDYVVYLRVNTFVIAWHMHSARHSGPRFTTAGISQAEAIGRLKQMSVRDQIDQESWRLNYWYLNRVLGPKGPLG